MNKLLRSITGMHSNTTANEDRFAVTPNYVDTALRIDVETWRYFENLDEDSRNMMARVLKDYVEKQR